MKIQPEECVHLTLESSTEDLFWYMREAYPQAMYAGSLTYMPIYLAGHDAKMETWDLVRVAWDDQNEINESGRKIKRHAMPFKDNTNGAVRAVLDYFYRHYPGAMRDAAINKATSDTYALIQSVVTKLEAYDKAAKDDQERIDRGDPNTQVACMGGRKIMTKTDSETTDDENDARARKHRQEAVDGLFMYARVKFPDAMAQVDTEGSGTKLFDEGTELIAKVCHWINALDERQHGGGPRSK